MEVPYDLMYDIHLRRTVNEAVWQSPQAKWFRHAHPGPLWVPTSNPADLLFSPERRTLEANSTSGMSIPVGMSMRAVVPGVEPSVLRMKSRLLMMKAAMLRGTTTVNGLVSRGVLPASFLMLRILLDRVDPASGPVFLVLSLLHARLSNMGCLCTDEVLGDTVLVRSVAEPVGVLL